MPVLTFKGKTAVETYHHTVPHHTLEFDRKLSVIERGEKPALDRNLIIEGDNLLALKALLPTHAGRIKCIYIDPPYNTGNEGWVYNDNLTQPQFKEWIGQVVGKDGEDACRHDKWCCMMFPRLQLLRELLREDGVILISIDENEVLHLHSLLMEVFGEENFLEMIVWQKSYGGGAKSKHFVRLHEYVLCFAKNKNRIGKLVLPPDPETRKYYKLRDEKSDVRGPYRLQPLWTNSMDERKKLRYAIPFQGSEVWPEKQWQWSEERSREALEANELVFVAGERGFSVYYKQYLLDEDGTERGAKPYSLIEGIYTQQGTNELERILPGQQVFKFPKPVGLLRYFFQLFVPENEMVLDCTAGSGTTAHAVLALNKADGGNRRFVLVQMPHDTKDHKQAGINICEEITAERVRRVIKGYKAAGRGGESKVVEGLGGSFSYARVGPPILGEARSWGSVLPAYEDLARYVFYTETSREFDPKALSQTTGKIGEHAGTSFYLLYTPDPMESRALDQAFVQGLRKDKNPRKVVYCEKVWMFRDDLAALRPEVGEVRPMLLPFQVK